MTQWQPIEAAPMDGTPILAYVPEGEHNNYWWGDNPISDGSIQAVICFINDEWQFFYVHTHDRISPTHWRLLPPAPQPPSTGDAE